LFLLYQDKLWHWIMFLDEYLYIIIQMIFWPPDKSNLKQSGHCLIKLPHYYRKKPCIIRKNLPLKVVYGNKCRTVSTEIVQDIVDSYKETIISKTPTNLQHTTLKTPTIPSTYWSTRYWCLSLIASWTALIASAIDSDCLEERPTVVGLSMSCPLTKTLK
jgi:hypothetical protein